MHRVCSKMAHVIDRRLALKACSTAVMFNKYNVSIESN